MPEDVDLVILEYGVNDITYHGEALPTRGVLPGAAYYGAQGNSMFLSSERMAYERLLRVLLALPSRPAVVLVEAFSWLMANGARELLQIHLEMGDILFTCDALTLFAHAIVQCAGLDPCPPTSIPSWLSTTGKCR